ncbi:hypothetical protein AZE42_07787, partial [Rhizopogon vesiculosus]
KPVTFNLTRSWKQAKYFLVGGKGSSTTVTWFSAKDFATEEDDAKLATRAEDHKATASRMVAPLITSKNTVSNIQKCNQVQEGLKDDPNARAPVCIYVCCNARTRQLVIEVPQVNPPPVVAPIVTSVVPSRAPSPQPVETKFEFSDTTAFACLLCVRRTNIYAQGAGLGASKGRELGKYNEGYTGYVHMAQDTLRANCGAFVLVCVLYRRGKDSEARSHSTAAVNCILSSKLDISSYAYDNL